MTVFYIYRTYSQLYEVVINNRKAMVKEKAFIFIITKCRLWRNVGCLRKFMIIFYLHIYEKQLVDNSFSLPSASVAIFQNILVKIVLTSEIILRIEQQAMKVFQKPVIRCLNIFVIFSSNN